jgi:polyphosphate glucokinase
VNNDKTHNLTVGFDIGGSAIKAGLVDLNSGRLQNEVAIMPLPQPARPDVLLNCIHKHLKKLNWDGPFGVGYPGVVKDGQIRSAAHVDTRFIGLDWLTQLRELTKGHVALINDADAAGLAEMKFGVGALDQYQDVRNKTVLLITFGTGIGTALFRDGVLVPNTEFGHLQLGDSEAEEQAAAAVRVKENLSWSEYGGRVDRFLAEMDRLLSPDLIIIGGGISENYDKFGAHLHPQAALAPAKMGNQAGLIGAALNVLKR